jgi:hypothetical protein
LFFVFAASRESTGLSALASDLSRRHLSSVVKMGKAARFACILAPLLMTMASLICIVLVGLGGTNKRMAVLDSFYFFKVSSCPTITAT